MTRVYLGLGTNLGNRQANLHEALRRLGALGRVVATSAIYETAPWGVKEQPAFLNMACALETRRRVATLLRAIKRIEQEMGRQKTVRYGPRLIDIDILLYGGLVVQTPELTIPHVGLHERAFVLAPLNDIAPDVIHPVLHKTVRALAEAVDRSEVHRLPDATKRV